MEYIAKHQDADEARKEFYADADIWDHEYDDPYEAQEDDE